MDGLGLDFGYPLWANGAARASSPECTKQATVQDSRSAARYACRACFAFYTERSSAFQARMYNSKKNDDVLAIMRLGALTEDQTKALVNFNADHMATRSQAKRDLQESIRRILVVRTWCAMVYLDTGRTDNIYFSRAKTNKKTLAAVGLDVGCTPNGLLESFTSKNTDTQFMGRFLALYHSDKKFKDSILMGITQAVIAKACGI